jgi:squalene-hopene/tetraprenyl-beta-curcumene cyclase
MDSVLATLEQDVARLGQRWPALVALSQGPRSNYFALPVSLATLFPGVAPDRAHSFALACRLLAGSILSQDRIVDGGSGDAALSLRSMALQAESYQQFHRLFAPEARFWERLQQYLAEYAGACLEEQRFVSGQRPWSEYTESVGLGIVKGKNAVARTVPAGLVELAREEHLLEPLLNVIDGFNVATQLWDDLQDWKEDLRRGVPSILLARVVRERPVALEEEQWKQRSEHLAREIYYGGHASHVLRMALDGLGTARRFLTDHELPEFRALLERLNQRLELLLKDLERIVAENVKRSQREPAGASVNP